MSVGTAYEYTCQFCNAVQDVFASMQIANKAATSASRGDYERAKAIILGARSQEWIMVNNVFTFLYQFKVEPCGWNGIWLWVGHSLQTNLKKKFIRLQKYCNTK